MHLLTSSLILSIFLAFMLGSVSRAQTAENIHINYCVDPNWAPYESINEGQHIGISKKFLDIFSQKKPFTFTLVPTKDWEQTLAYVKSGKCHITPMLNSSPQRAQYLLFSDIYFRAPNALYGHFKQSMVGSLSGIKKQTLAVVKNYRMHQYLRTNFPHINLVLVENEQQGLVKVANKEVDYFVGSFYAANSIIQTLSLSSLRMVGISEASDNLRIGINKNSAYLLPHLNDAINQLTEAEQQQIFSYLTTINLVSKQDYTISIITVLVFSLFSILIWVHYKRSIRYAKILAEKNDSLRRLHLQLEEKNKLLEEVAIRDSLTGLYNRNHLLEVIQQQININNRYNNHPCLMMVDIDDFKKINDTFGHKIGDDILKYFSLMLTECSRDADIVARWGGEEFVLVCPETNIADAQSLAFRFQEKLRANKKSALPDVTCSIGIAELNDNYSADDWFVSADKAMYQAKENGKNAIFTVENVN